MKRNTPKITCSTENQGTDGDETRRLEFGIETSPKDNVVIDDPNQTDNRKRQFLYLTAILSYLALAVMLLSIIAADNFGEKHKESFEM